jgi:hypothetical protein
MIKDAIKERMERLEDKNDLNVSMRPEFVQALQNCMSFSSKIKVLNQYLISGERQGLFINEIFIESQANEGAAGGGHVRGVAVGGEGAAVVDCEVGHPKVVQLILGGPAGPGSKAQGVRVGEDGGVRVGTPKMCSSSSVIKE